MDCFYHFPLNMPSCMPWIDCSQFRSEILNFVHVFMCTTPRSTQVTHIVSISYYRDPFQIFFRPPPDSAAKPEMVTYPSNPYGSNDYP